MKKICALTLSVLMLLCCLTACGKKAEAPAAEAPAAATKMALLCSGPINDGGWNTDAYNGLIKAGEKYGWETAYTENIIAADIPNILRNYAESGYSLIVGNGYEFCDYMMAIGDEFPDTYFFAINGLEGNGKNVGSGAFVWYEIGYLTANLAARSTKSGKVGCVGASETPGIAAEFRAFEQIVTEMVPGSTVSISYTGSWTDVAKGYEAANAMINAGVDVIMGIGDACDAGIIQACEESNGKCRFIGFSGDFNHLSPAVVICSGVQSTTAMIDIVAQDYANGNFKAEVSPFGLFNGASYMGVWAADVDETIKSDILAIEASLKDGSLVLDTSKWE